MYTSETSKLSEDPRSQGVKNACPPCITCLYLLAISPLSPMSPCQISKMTNLHSLLRLVLSQLGAGHWTTLLPFMLTSSQSWSINIVKIMSCHTTDHHRAKYPTSIKFFLHHDVSFQDNFILYFLIYNLGLSIEQYKPLVLYVYYSRYCLWEVASYHSVVLVFNIHLISLWITAVILWILEVILLVQQSYPNLT